MPIEMARCQTCGKRFTNKDFPWYKDWWKEWQRWVEAGKECAHWTDGGEAIFSKDQKKYANSCGSIIFSEEEIFMKHETPKN